MKPNRVAAVILLLAAVSSFNLRAQFSARDIPPGGTYRPDTNIVILPPTSAGDLAAVPARDGAEAETASDLENSSFAPAVVSVPPLSQGVSPIVAGYLPARDTNVAIGVTYPTGSSDFMYVIAGRPRPGDPRVAGAQTTTAMIVSESGPVVIYERAAPGSGAVMTRYVEEKMMFDFPPGTSFRRPVTFLSSGHAESSTPLPPGAVGFRERTTTESGEPFVRNFPPGARLARATPSPQDAVRP